MIETMTLDAKIEALLFWKAEPISLKKISEIFDVSVEDVQNAISELSKNLEKRGLSIIELNNEVTLGTHKLASDFIEKLTKEELVKDLGKAGLETISIIMYQGPISRSEIDYIRGVNSNFIVRNLLVRGLIEKVENPKDQRSFLYRPTLELLSFLGVQKIEEIPEYAQLRQEIEQYKNHEQIHP